MERCERASHTDRPESRDHVSCHVASMAQKSPKAVALHSLHNHGSLKFLKVALAADYGYCIHALTGAATGSAMELPQQVRFPNGVWERGKGQHYALA